MIEHSQPTFIVAGGVRCATGWIRECLSEHPEVYMQPKETHYFDQNYEKGKEWYSEFLHYKTVETIIGEKTASYLHSDQVANRIKESLPNVKLVFCLRDPVERMYSHYALSASNDNDLRQRGFLECLDFEPKFMEWGKYFKQLTPFLSEFPRENILIKIYEDIQTNPFTFISEIYDFIGANSDFKAPSTQLRTKLGQLEHNSLLWGSFSKIMLHPRAPFFLRSIYTSIRPDENRNVFTENVYRRFADYYRDDMLQLEELLDRDLRVWRTRRFVVD
jgi:hypothetical protein